MPHNCFVPLPLPNDGRPCSLRSYTLHARFQTAPLNQPRTISVAVLKERGRKTPPLFGQFAAVRTIKHDPGPKVGASVLEMMLHPSGHEQRVTATDWVAIIAAYQDSLSIRHYVEFILIMGRLRIRLQRNIETKLKASVSEQQRGQSHPFSTGADRAVSSDVLTIPWRAPDWVDTGEPPIASDANEIQTRSTL
jgi:hypothetical protein